MKDKKTKDKALGLYLNGLSEAKIAKEIGVTPLTINSWKNKYKWRELKEDTEAKTISKINEKYSDKQAKLIETQIEIGELATKELKKRLEEQDEVLKLIKEMKEVWIIIKKKETITKQEFLEFANNLAVLYRQLENTRNLIDIMKHLLEILRPKNISKRLNVNVDVTQEQLNKQIIELVGNVRDGTGK